MSEVYNDISFLPISQTLNTDTDIPLPSYANPKIIFVEYLKNLFGRLNLSTKIIISTAFPSEVYFTGLKKNISSQIENTSLTPDGGLDYAYKRGINILLKQQKISKYVGNILRNDVYGYLEEFTLSFYVWSFDPLDRDILGDFVVRVLYEAQESQYLLKRGIPDFYVSDYRDEQDEKVILNHPLFYRDITALGKRLIFGKKTTQENIVFIEDVISNGYPVQIEIQL